MKTKKYVIALSSEERQQLQSLLRKGKHAAREITSARALLLADAGQPEKEIAAQLGVDFTTVYRIEQHYCENGLPFALSERPRSGAPPKTDARDEAIIGYARDRCKKLSLQQNSQSLCGNLNGYLKLRKLYLFLTAGLGR